MAHQDVFEESKLTIKVKLKARSKKNADTAKLILKVDGVEESPITLQVKKQWVEHEHTFKKVPDDKDHYPFQYRIEYDGEDKPGDTTCTVWPRDVNIKLVHVISKDPLKNTHFMIAVGGFNIGHYKSGEDGTSNCKLKNHGAVRIHQSEDLRFHGWHNGKSKGRNREALIEPIEYDATLITPAWKDQTVKQYVNVASKKSGNELGHDKLGRKIRFEIGLHSKNSPTPVTVNRSGVRVYVKATLSDLTKRDAELATLEDVQALKREGDVVTGYALTQNGKAHFTLVLGVGGDEKCKLEVGTSDECKDAKVEFTNLRKIWLQSIAAGAPPDTADAKAWLLETAIEVEDEDAIEADPDTLPAGTMLPGACLGEASDVLIVGDHNVSSLVALWQRTHAPLSAYTIFCEYQFDGGKNERVKQVNATFKKKQPRWIKVVDTANDEEIVLSHSLHTGKFAVTRTWASLAKAGDTKGKKGDLAEADFTIDADGHAGEVKVKLPDDATKVIDAGEKVRVRLKAVYVKGDYDGWAPGGANVGGVVIATKNIGSPISEDSINKTIVHEIGHLIGMVEDPRAGVTLTLDADHEWHYTDRGHSGGHCAFGISKTDYDSGGDLDGKDGTCTMFGEASNSQQGSFCVKCKPFVLATSLEALS